MRIAIGLVLGIWACGSDPQLEDSGARDGSADAGRDAQSMDGTTDEDGGMQSMDGATTDAEPRDGEPTDGTIEDTGGMDATPSDAGPIDGGFLPNFSQRPLADGFFHGQAATPIDIDDDGDLDVIAALSLDDAVRIHFNSGDGSSWTTRDVAPAGAIVAMHAVAADLDGDSDLDIAAVGLFDRSIGFASEGEVTWFESSGDPMAAWTEQTITGLTFWGPRYVALGDLTGDGLPEIVVGALTSTDQNGGEQGNGVHWFRNGGGSFTGPTAIDPDLRNVGVVLLHDVDGNGVLDVIAAGGGSSEIAWYENQRPPGQMQQSPTFVHHTLFAVNAPNGLALAQRDPDPELELIATGDNGGGGLITVLDPPADPRNAWSSEPIATDHGAGNPVRVAAADLNLDGLVDVAIAGADSIRAYVDDGSGGWILRVVQEPFTGVDFVAIGDIDRDGIPDLVTSTYGNDPNNGDRIDWWRTRP